MSDVPSPPSYASILTTRHPSPAICPSKSQLVECGINSMDSLNCETSQSHPSSDTLNSLGGHSPSIPAPPPSSDGACPPSPPISNSVHSSITVNAPTLSEATIAEHKSKKFMLKFGESLYLMLLSPLGLNLVLIPWEPNFFAFNNEITHIDQWVKIPFLPTEYWTWDHCVSLTSSIGTLIKLDEYTLRNDDKAQFARVCLNIDISKPVPCTLSMHIDHTLKACPKKPTPSLELIVAQLEASNLDHQGEQAPLPHSDWIHVKPQRRARPRFFSRGGKSGRGAFNSHFSRFNNTVYSPNPNPTNFNQFPSSSSNHGEVATVPISNAFASLGEFQVSTGEKITLNPPVPEKESFVDDEDDLDEAFFNALGVIHHSPEINFDADMTASPSCDTNKSENSKRRKRDDGDVGSPTSVMNYD
uniref:DUF4283 domain-containing protein n=1 Tax=Chenopodium quinoa TaxID=63459 RepID=A0A803LN34_CHEQI